MNTIKSPHWGVRIPHVRLMLAPALAALAALPGQAQQTATATVNASTVIRDIPAGLNSACFQGKFWESLNPNYRDGLIETRIGLVRMGAYPIDGGTTGSVEQTDIKVAQIINAGAAPFFIQQIESDTANDTYKNALLRLDGTVYPTGDPTPINQRVATNMTYLVNRYKSAPFNLQTQYWEVGNEPDIAINYQVSSTDEYNAFFTNVHNRLESSGVRDNVLLAGPTVSYDYGFGGFKDALMQDFLTDCRDMVDLVTRHIYAEIAAWETGPNTPYNLLNAPYETSAFNSAQTGSRGEGALLDQMETRGVPASVGTGVTEMNVGSSVFQFHIAQGLWLLLSNHYSLYNPRSQVNAGFQFDKYADGQPGGTLGFYDGARNRSFAYWAAYIQGVLTGDQVIAQTSSNSHLVVTGSKDDRYIYVRVMNRHHTDSISTTITLNNSGGVGAPTMFTFSETQNPLTGTTTAYGTTFTRSFAPMTATVFRYPRNSAPPIVPPPAPPTTTHLTTSFDSTPANMQTYQVGFTPVVAGSRLQLTSTAVNSRAAVIFNGQPLTASRNRAQIRFGFRASDSNGEGFVFGAYSANPGSVGNAGQALGYQGQNHRLWGVKMDNNPDQIAIVATTVNSIVDGWATKAIQPYGGQDRFMVIDYDGGAGTVRARLYQGTTDAGTLLADLTNKLGNPATLPAGTVFGFTAATTATVQPIYINDLTIRADNGGGTFVLGQEVIVDNPAAVRTGTWVLNQNMTSGFYGTTYDHDGDTNKGSCTATYTPSLSGTGYRDVYVRYCGGSNRASNARYTVHHAGGIAPILVNQRVDSGTWVKIGTWNFNNGSGGYVVLDNGSTDGFVIADAVRFVSVSGPPDGFVLGTEVIVDNPAAVRTGTWVLNQNMTSGFYGTTYDHDGNTNKGSCTATYTPTLTGTGYRDVYVRYCGGSNRASNARYTAHHASGTAPTVLVNQRVGSGTWVKIGTWNFNNGTGGSVVLSNTSTDGVVIADAVRFVNVAAP